MTLLTLILALALQQVWQQGARLRSFNGFYQWIHFVEAKFYDQPAWLIICLAALPVFVLVFISQSVLAMLFWGVAWLIFSVLLLWYCFDPAFKQQQQAVPATTAEECFWQSHEQFFAVIFWFAVLGIYGAIVYRLLEVVVEYGQKQHQQDSSWQFALHLHGLMAWLPARLSALSFCCCGQFEPGLAAFRQWAWRLGSSKMLLQHTGMASLWLAVEATAVEQNQAAELLVQRCLVAWIMLIALLTIVHVLF